MSKAMLPTALSTAALMAAFPLALPAAGTDTAFAPALSATVEQCDTAAAQTDRSVTFTGQMETVAGAHRMAIEIEVQEHAPEEEGFHTLSTAGLGAWQRSEAGVRIYKVRQAVTDLPAPAVFRAIVHYRWLNEKGQVIRRDERRTPVCRQPAPASSPAAGLSRGGRS
jgi:hypothetical protein